jgi:hypothetical protein
MKNSIGIAIVCAAVWFLAACPDVKYHVYYSGSGHTEGSRPVDGNRYVSGDMAVILGPGNMKKGGQTFQGWRRRDWGNSLYQPGTRITIDHEDIEFYAVWDGEDPLFKYTVEAGETAITAYTGDYYSSDEVIIPDTLGGCPVTSIGAGAFREKHLYDIVFPAGLTAIGDYAFNANYLASLSLPPGLRTIGTGAFSGNRITMIALPPGLLTVGTAAFSGNAITVIEIGDNVDIKSDSSLGSSGAGFRAHYETKGKAAGVYLYTSGAWRGPYTDAPAP